MINEDEVDRQLHHLLEPRQISRSEAVLRRYASDALRPSRLPRSRHIDPHPQWVVHPETIEQVQDIVRLANRTSVPIVPFGGGTGLMGGALPACGGIVLEMSGLSRVRSVSPEDSAVTAEAGVVLGDLEAVLRQEGLILGHDPWTLPVATVGGAISTDGLGYRGAQYGSMGDQVLGIEAVLPDGALLQTRAVPKRSTGISLNHLFIGGEGAFGVITAATLRVFPEPEARVLRSIAFPSFEAGFRAVHAMFAAGLVPSLVDYGEEFDSETSFPHHGPAGDARSELVLGFEGPRELVEAQDRRARVLWEQRGGVEEDPAQAREFWEGRHNAAVRYVRNLRDAGVAPFLQDGSGPAFDYVHVALPASRVLEYRRRALEIAARCEVRVRECGLWNRPELFSLALAPSPEGPEGAMSEAVDAVLELAQDLGGSMEYCHGVGVRLAHLMGRELGSGLEVLRALKRSLDPANIMNPGKLGL